MSASDFVFIFIVLRRSSILCFNCRVDIIIVVLLGSADARSKSAADEDSLVRATLNVVVFVKRCTRKLHA